MEDDMLKAQSKVVDILCNLELIYPLAFFDIMIHLIRQRHVDKDLGVSASSKLVALACGPTPTPISINSCVVNGVRFVMHSRDERRTTQKSGICSPGGKDGEMYYGQLQEILEFSFLFFKVVLFRVNLNDLDFATLHIYGQSTDVDAPPDIIDVDEDDDIIDDEDALPHDLADSDDDELVNVDDDDMSADVAWGHGGDGGSDDRFPSHSNHAAHWANYLGELVRELSMHYPSWRQHLQKIYNGNKSALKAQYWVQNPETGTYNVESIRRGRPATFPRQIGMCRLPS
uniref:Uncharacterized protein n=1 Tax=Tanacetum cinerariifolium TaxID=118510 RepID=A0A699IDR5_TANCI|nr:hypothetical protein [Tanacetum cinerariifolium]